MTMMITLSLCVLLLIGGAVLVATNPSWLSNLFSGKSSPGVIDWATGAPGYTSAPTQMPYMLPVPPLYTLAPPAPVYTWAQPVKQ